MRKKDKNKRTDIPKIVPSNAAVTAKITRTHCVSR